MKHALITGVKGQDGSYLAELLVANGYSVSGVDRAGGGSIEGGANRRRYFVARVCTGAGLTKV